MIRPPQRIPFSQKNQEWVEQSARYYSSMMIYAIDRKHADILYRAANGELEEEDYLYVTNPRNVQSEKLKRFPTKLRNFDIISPNVMLLMGEKRRRGCDFTVTAINSNIEDLRKQLQDQLVDQYLTQQLMQEVVTQQVMSGQQPNIPQDQQLTAQEIQKKVSGLQDKLAIQAQAALDYIREGTDLDSKFVENFYHWLCTARCFSYKEPCGDEVEFSDISPLNFKYLANSRTRFIKDAEACEYFVRMPISEVIDKFQGVKEFTEDVIKQLEAKMGYGIAEGFSTPGGLSGPTDRDFFSLRGDGLVNEMWSNLNRRWGESRIYSDSEGIFVQHIVWTSMCKRAQITIPNMFGEPTKVWVDEDYIPQEGEEIDWIWKRQKWHCYIIDDMHVVGGEAIDYTEEGIGKCENPYNGRIFNLKHVNPMSTVEKGIAYQIKYNIVHYYIEKTFAKNPGKILIMPMSLIPEQADLGLEETMYYMDATGMIFADDSKKNAQTALNGIKVLDADLGQHINQLYEYLRIIKDEWDSVIGITPQRKGQMNASDGKATTDNSVFRSSIMTEELFTQYEELEETDLNGLLELSKVAFADGKKAMFIRGTKNEQALLDIDPEPFCFANYLVKAKNSGKNLEKMAQAKQMAQALTQNKDGRFSDVVRVIQSDNISELLEEMEQVEAAFDAKQQAQSQAQQQSQQELEQLKKDIATINSQASGYRADRQYDAVIEAATIKADASLDISKFNDPALAPTEIAALDANSIKRQEVQARQEIERERIQAERDRTKTEAETKKYIVDKQSSNKEKS